MIISPLKYLGNVLPAAKNIFDLIGTNKTYSCFYDLFSGSASMALLAIENNLAEKYIINDAYEPLKDLWQSIYYDPQRLIGKYQTLLNGLLCKPTPITQAEYYEIIQQEYNSSPATEIARFAFLLNFSEFGAPILNHGKLQCSFSFGPDFFAERVLAAHALLHKPGISVQFTCQNFMDFNDDITENDLVFLDPPFPDSLDANESPEQHVYFRTDTKLELTKKLDKMLLSLEEKKAAYMCIYNVVTQDDPYLLKNAGKHLIQRIELPSHPLKYCDVNFYVGVKLLEAATAGAVAS